MRIKWEPIPHSERMHGERATVGDRHVEVVRAYAGQWFCFGTIGGRIIRKMPDETCYMTYSDAKARGAAILRGELTPECWPKQEP